jgi:hypothetical protein
MTQPNPFSTANSLEHLVNPKVITVSGNYEVAVDIANVDTYYGRQLGGPTASQEIQQAYIRQIGTTGISGQAFFNQIGTTGSSGQAFFNTIGSSTSRGDGYFDTVYWNNLVPFPNGGGGGGTTFFAGPGISIAQNNDGATFSANLQGVQGINVSNPTSGPVTIGYNAPGFTGGTGINVSFVGNTYRFTSNLGIVGSQYIGVQQTGNTYTVSYLGSQGGSGTISGISGAYAVFGASGLESSTVLTSTNIVGPTGRVMLYSPQGPTYNNLLTYADSAFPRIITPIVESRFDNGILSLVPFADENFIQSAGTNAKAFPLQISGGAGSPNLTTFDIPQGKVTINPNYDFPSGVNNVFSGSTAGTQTISGGGTFNVYLYGGGGAGLSGFAGGAGGFVKINGITGGTGATIFTFQELGNANGGGTGIRLNINGTDIAVAPAGGAGGSAGPGAAYGELGGSYNGQGFSARDSNPPPGAGGTGGIFTDVQTNGLTGFVYRLGTTGATAQSGIFNNVQVTYGLTGNLAVGTRITGYGVITNTPGVVTTYYFPPGSTLSVQTDGITFGNSLYSFTGVTAGIIDLSNINTSSLTGATLARQAVGGTATVEGSTYQFQQGYVAGTFVGDGSGIDQMLIGATFSIGLTGLTLSVNGPGFNDINIPGGIQIDFSTGLTFNLSRSLGNVIAPSVRITDPIFIGANSIIQVQYQTNISRGQNGQGWSVGNGGFFGGGNGDFGGGGGTGGGGGGAGAVYILPGYTGITGAGSGTSPYFGQYNLNGQYGFGGSGTQGGSPYYVIEKVDASLQPDVLQVNGNETVSGNLIVNGNETVTGNLNVNGNISAYQPNTGGIQALLVHNNFDVNNRRGVSVFVDKTVEGPSISFDNNSTTLSGPANQGGLLSYTRDTSGGFFSMTGPLSVQGNIYGYQTPIKVLLDSPVEVATNYIVPPNLPGSSGYLVHLKMFGAGGSAAIDGGGGGSGFIVDTDGITLPGGSVVSYTIGEGGGSTAGGPGSGGGTLITFPGYQQLIAGGGNPGNSVDGGVGGYGGGGRSVFPSGLGGRGQLGNGNPGPSAEGGGPSVLGLDGSGNVISGGGGRLGTGLSGGGGGGLGGGNVRQGNFPDEGQNATSYGGGGGGPFLVSGGLAYGRGYQGVIFLTLTPY